MRSRGAFTLVESTVAAALVALVVTAMALQQRAGAAEAAHHEDRQDLVAAATVLQRALSRDTRRSLSLSVLDAADRPRGEPLRELVLALQAGYRGDAARALRYRRLAYSWDPAARRLTRDGRALPLPGVEALRFLWSEGSPTVLTVELEGVAHGLGRAAALSFEVVAPGGTDAPEGWTPAPHHRGGAVEVSDGPGGAGHSLSRGVPG